MAEEFGTVVIGAGLAGGTVVESLRDSGYTGTVALVGAEPAAPYYRPDLSKKVMIEGSDPADSALRGEDWYSAHDVSTFLGTSVTSMDVSAHTVVLDDDRQLSYGQAILATGAHPRTLDVPGAQLGNVHTLRDAGDAVAIRSQFGEGKKVAVIGGGWIGLEVAAAAKQNGCDVTVILNSDAPPLSAVLGQELGEYFEELHRKNGVNFLKNANTTAFTGDSAVAAVETSAGSVPADLVVVGIGAAPAVELAASAGLDVDNGVIVDEQMRTSDGNVLAIGDIANAQNVLRGERLRVEHWDNSVRQAAVAASTITGGTSVYDWQPYFYTDQFDLGMEYVGRGGPEDEAVIRGDKSSGEFIVFWRRDGKVAAAMNVNVWDFGDELRALIGKEVSAERLADEQVPVGEL